MDNLEKLREIARKSGVEDQINWESPDAAMHLMVFGKVKSLLPAAADFIGLQAAELSNRLAVKGAISSKIVNAQTSSSDGWNTFDISVNFGLMMFLHHMSKAFITRVGFVTDGAREEPQHSFDQTLDAFRELATAYFSGRLISPAGVQLAALSEQQIELHATMLHYMESFVVAHEFGHIAQNVSSEELLEQRFMRGFAAHLLQPEPNLSEADKSQLIDNWSDELAADNVGMKILCRSAGKADAVAFTACEFFFVLVRLLEEFYQREYGKTPPIGTHPPANIRLGVLRGSTNLKDALPKQPGSQALGEVFLELAESLIQKL